RPSLPLPTLWTLFINKQHLIACNCFLLFYLSLQNVYLIINGQVSVEGQDPEYKNRVESFSEEYLRGNFSIKLNNLQHTDAGEYWCYIIEESVHNRRIKVELLTKERKAIQLPNEGTKPRPDVIIMIIYVLCLGIIFSLTNSVPACF
ncbi:CD276 antigen homolog, partial [Carassius auratus]|uniref:CD276 antigen homolog n=1 Tax=Carassius auratus TaxID=7957 RepID=A0A6P6MQL3_CARAU